MFFLNFKFMMYFRVVLLNLCSYLLSFELFIIVVWFCLNCFCVFLILELLYCYSLRMFCNVRT